MSLNLSRSKEGEKTMAKHRIGYIGVGKKSSKGSLSKRIMTNKS